MSFAAEGLNCIGVGPQKFYVYTTTDTLTSVTAKASFNTKNCPGMVAGDIILIAHNTAADLSPIRITDIDAISCTYTSVTALA